MTELQISTPLVPTAAKPAKVAKDKATTLSRKDHAAAVAALSVDGWSLVNTTPARYLFHCACNGVGRMGFVLEPKSPLAGPQWALDFVDDQSPVSVGTKSCTLTPAKGEDESAKDYKTRAAKVNTDQQASDDARAESAGPIVVVKVGATCLYHFGIRVR